MKRYFLLFICSLVALSSIAKKRQQPDKPRLVVGVVIDQMRWDYLYRYAAHYGTGGFRRLMDKGFNCQNTMINYLPSFTAPGHTCIYTGSVPSLHGIAANDWVDNATGRQMYCTQDDSVQLVGAPSAGKGSMSPANMLVTTVTDELRLATNFGAQVYGISIKDRGAILPAGHLANGAYWLDESTGYFCTSTYYAKELPQWMQAFNNRKVPDSLMRQDWTLLRDPKDYTQSLPDNNKYEKGFKNDKAPVFPHKMTEYTGKDRYSTIKATPWGNQLTLEAAKACIGGNKLGSGSFTDFLCVSFSSTDYVGHQYAPNSMEVEDTYLRLDQQLADLLEYLDDQVGKGQYTLFLTADHGAAHNPQFLLDKNVPAGFLSNKIKDSLNNHLKSLFGADGLVSHFTNYQVYLADKTIESSKLDREKVKAAVMSWLGARQEVSYVIDMQHPDATAVPEPVRTMAVNGYNKHRSGCIQVIPAPGWFEGYGKTGTTHGTWNPYDAHIPLLWYGAGITPGETHDLVHMTDIAATVAALLHIQMPNGCIGTPVRSIVK